MGIFSRNKSSASGGNTKFSQSLKDEKQKASIIVDSIDDAVVLIDSENIIQIFNPAAAQLTGWPAEEAANIDYRTVVRLSDNKGQQIPESQHPFYTIFTNKQPVRSNQLNLLTKDGRHIPVDMSITPLIDSNQLVSGAVGVFRNVQQQRAEEQRRQDFISTASHEMRTPVAAIEGYLSLAMNDKVCQIDEKARSYLDKAHASTDHLGKLFQDLLTSAKAEDGRLTSHPTLVNISEFVENLVEDLKFSAEKKGLALELIHGAQGNTATIAPLLYANVDPDRLREVITNLFDNAVKYTENGKITVGLTGDTNVVQFYIKDTGPGIPKTDIGHLFQKFYRVDNSATRTIGGTGLGLFICKKIVELYNGKIWAESDVGQGSTFYINLPRVDSQTAQRAVEQANGPTVVPVHPTNQPSQTVAPTNTNAPNQG